MKNTKKFLLGVFAISALMLGACSGNNKPAPSSSVEPAPSASSSQATSSEPEASTSVAPETSSEDPESSTSEPEPSSSEEVVTEHTVTVNEAPTAGRVVVVHAWDLGGGFVDVQATVADADVTFDLGSDDWAGYLIAELKEGKTFDDFSFFDPEDPTKIEHDWNVVARQTNNITDMSATEASWRSIAPTSEFDAVLDPAAATAYSGRTLFVCSWKDGYENAYSFFTASGKVAIATDADGFLVAALKEGKTAADGVGEDWANVDDASKSVDVTTMPEEKITVAVSGAKFIVAVDEDEPTAENIVQVWSKINITADNLDKPAYAWIFTNETDGVWYAAAHVAETWETNTNRHYTVNVGAVDPTGKKIVFAVFSSVTGETPNWDDKIVQSDDCTIAYSGGSFWVDATAA